MCLIFPHLYCVYSNLNQTSLLLFAKFCTHKKNQNILGKAYFRYFHVCGRLSLVTISSLHNNSQPPPEMEINPPKTACRGTPSLISHLASADVKQHVYSMPRPLQRGNGKKQPCTQPSHPVECVCPCTVAFTGPCGPLSTQLRNDTAMSTPFRPAITSSPSLTRNPSS